MTSSFFLIKIENCSVRLHSHQEQFTTLTLFGPSYILIYLSEILSIHFVSCYSYKIYVIVEDMNLIKIT